MPLCAQTGNNWTYLDCHRVSTDIFQCIYYVWFAVGGEVRFTLDIETVKPAFIAARDGECVCVCVLVRFCAYVRACCSCPRHNRLWVECVQHVHVAYAYAYEIRNAVYRAALLCHV